MAITIVYLAFFRIERVDSKQSCVKRMWDPDQESQRQIQGYRIDSWQEECPWDAKQDSASILEDKASGLEIYEYQGSEKVITLLLQTTQSGSLWSECTLSS